MADQSSCEVSLDNINYSRISCLLMQEGTKRAQNAVLDNLPERKSFTQVLSENHDKLHKLMTKRRVLTRSQYEVLYPFNGDTSKIDISLWIVLARNITVKSSRKGINWSKSPEKHETMWAHDLIRLREIRNFLFHISAPELIGERYVEIKNELIRVLRRLGTPDDVINDHMMRDLDPQQTRISVLQIREQYMDEQNSLLHQAAKHKNHTRLLTVVMSLLAVLVLIAVSIPVGWYITRKLPCSKFLTRLRTDSGVFYFMRRSGWNALPMKDPDTTPVLKKPVRMVAVFHTAIISDQQCKVTEDCCEEVKLIQKAQMHYWSDISYNYLIGDDGVIYEGRGSLYEGAAVFGRNSELISIALMGNYACAWPSDTAMMALYAFLEYLTVNDPSDSSRKSVLQRNYTLYGHCQVNIRRDVQYQDSPGTGVMQNIMYWDHWNSDNVTRCDVTKDCLRSSLCCRSPSKNITLNEEV